MLLLVWYFISFDSKKADKEDPLLNLVHFQTKLERSKKTSSLMKHS